ncbi:MAG: DUF3108 domain-containing protein [Verrucomicrobiales bacterium]|nr:DUF3108 domain-containing protein [Verrucomicrobiales bacterium]
MLLLFAASTVARPATTSLPWPDGEQLSYEVYWGVILAAEGTFSAKQQSDGWQFSLDLRSLGLVEGIAQIRSKVTSTVGLEPWSARQFVADRREGAKQYKYTCELGAGKKSGLYTNQLKPETKPIELPGPAVEDFVSMLYRLRWQDWEKQKSCDFVVSDRWKIYQGRAQLIKLDQLTDASGKPHPCYLIEAKEIGKDGKLIDQYYLRLWIPIDGTRAPLLARLKFKYGTVTIKPKQ